MTCSSRLIAYARFIYEAMKGRPTLLFFRVAPLHHCEEAGYRLGAMLNASPAMAIRSILRRRGTCGWLIKELATG
jgi:hypothetical protein